MYILVLYSILAAGTHFMIWKGFYDVFTSFVSLQMIVSLLNIFILMMTILIEMYLVFDRQCFSFFMNKLVILVCLKFRQIYFLPFFVHTSFQKKTI